MLACGTGYAHAYEEICDFEKICLTSNIRFRKQTLLTESDMLTTPTLKYLYITGDFNQPSPLKVTEFTAAEPANALRTAK